VLLTGRADGRRLRRDADRQHGGDLALVSAGPLLDADSRGVSIGLLGNLAATTPLAWASQAVGWRPVFGAVVVFTALATIAIWLVVRDAPARSSLPLPQGGTIRRDAQGMLEVLRNPRLKPILALNFCNYACTFTVQGLWGGAFLREVHGLSPIAAGNVLLCAVIAYQAGMLAFGPLDRRLDTRKGIAIGGTLVIICLLAILALFSPPAGLAAGRRHHRHGLLLASSTMVMTHGRGIFPDRLIGRGISTMNTSVMLGVACMQTLSGIIIGAFEPLAERRRTEEAYRALFGTLTLVLIVAVAIYSARRTSSRARRCGRRGSSDALRREAYDTPTNRDAAAIGKAAARLLTRWLVVGCRITPALTSALSTRRRSSRPRPYSSGPCDRVCEAVVAFPALKRAELKALRAGAIPTSIMRPSHFGHPGRRIGSRQGSGRVCSSA
jgi:hypothetical protein